MKDLTYGWKRYTGAEFIALSRSKKRNATVVVFTRGCWDGDGKIRKVKRVTVTGAVFVEYPEAECLLWIEHWFTVFMKVPTKVGRFIP